MAACLKRYCVSLPSADKSVLAPRWTQTTVNRNQLDDDQLQLMKHLGCAIDKNNMDIFQWKVTLPLNSPLRTEIVGHPFNNKQVSKQLTAMVACIRLHEMNELDDRHLLPNARESARSITGATATATARGQHKKGQQQPQAPLETFYRKTVPRAFQNCQPLDTTVNYLYLIYYDVVQPTCRTRNMDAMRYRLALLTSKPIPVVNSFPIFTQLGMINVRIKLSPYRQHLTRDKLNKCRRFYKFMIQEILKLKKSYRDMHFAPDACHLASYLMVPVCTVTNKIDYLLIDRLVNYRLASMAEQKHYDIMNGRFHCQELEYFCDDAVVVSCHRPAGFFPYYVGSISDLTPLAPFPETSFTHFADYYHKNYTAKVYQLDVPMLQVTKEPSKLNYLIPKYGT